jgi:hypothetical protein
MAQDFSKAVLAKLGTIKNPLLAFAIIGCLIMNVFAVPLDYSDKALARVMHGSSIFVFLVFGGVYCYLLITQPSSQQELLFTETAKKIVSSAK